MELTEADFEARYKALPEYEQNGGHRLYMAYRDAVEGVAYNGEKIPGWDNIKWRAKWGWCSAWEEAVDVLTF